jgi:hypothetical protein
VDQQVRADVLLNFWQSHRRQRAIIIEPTFVGPWQSRLLARELWEEVRTLTWAKSILVQSPRVGAKPSVFSFFLL